MRISLLLTACLLTLVTIQTVTAQDKLPAAPLGTPPIAAQSQQADDAPRGAPKNRWRYRFFDGRWWYWTPENRWSYFDGSQWRAFPRRDEYVRRPVDPALLRLEYKEGVLGRKRWKPVPSGGGGMGGWSVSGTQGSLGGSPSGSFTAPAGVPSALNSSSGTTTGVSGLGGNGRPNMGTGLYGR